MYNLIYILYILPKIFCLYVYINSQIATSNVNRLESSRAQHMSQLNKLEAQVKNLETTVTSLGQFISDLGYNHKDLNIPNDILRIVTQINVAEKQRKLLRCPIVPSELNSSKVSI